MFSAGIYRARTKILIYIHGVVNGAGAQVGIGVGRVCMQEYVGVWVFNISLLRSGKGGKRVIDRSKMRNHIYVWSAV